MDNTEDKKKQRFYSEVDNLKSIKSPYTVKYYNHFEENLSQNKLRLGLAMELMEGTLFHYIKKKIRIRLKNEARNASNSNLRNILPFPN